jgi:hypothetical protein
LSFFSKNGSHSKMETLVVDGGGNVPSLSSGVGELNYYGLLCLERGLAVV